jgi:hypothetical protein
MVNRATYYLKSEPAGALYRALLEEAVARAAVGYLIVRTGADLDQSARDLQNRLQRERTFRRNVAEWPGTTLLAGGRATMAEYRCSKRLLDALMSVTDRLYAWRHPRLPEDLGFLRADGSVWLATIAHEGEGFMSLTSAERGDLAERRPDLEALLGKRT